jgi:hypothetical protein
MLFSFGSFFLTLSITTSGSFLLFQSIVSISHFILVYPSSFAAFTVLSPNEPDGAWKNLVGSFIIFSIIVFEVFICSRFSSYDKLA